MNSPEKSAKHHINDPPSSPKSVTKQPSSVNKKQMKKIDDDLTIAKNKLALLRQQLQKQKDLVKKNKQLAQQAITKKVMISQIYSLKRKDNNQANARIQYLQKRNKSMKFEHEKSLQNIQKALYLVKLDDAREVKNISEEHRRKMRQMQNDDANRKFQMKRHQKQEASRAKERYMRYWQDKISSIYAEQALNKQQLSKNREEKLRELKMIQEQEIRLLEEINMCQAKSIEAKKQYVAALSLPAKQVAQALKIGKTQSDEANKFSISIDKSRSQSLGEIGNKSINKNRNQYSFLQQNSSLASIGQKMKVPHANNVSETKLKIILQELKRIEKNKQRYDQNPKSGQDKK